MASSVNTSDTRSGWCASMPAFQRSRASRSASVSGTVTSVHVQDLGGDKWRVLQIEHGLDDIVDVTTRPTDAFWPTHRIHRIVACGHVPRVGDDGVAQPSVAGDQPGADSLGSAGDADTGLRAHPSH